jgi:hypothetical protein
MKIQSGRQTREELERNDLTDGLKTGKHEVLSVKKCYVGYYHYVKHKKLLISSSFNYTTCTECVK